MFKDELNQHIARKLGAIDNRYRLAFHMSPRVGWMNDPNGLILYRGQYHLYYQANPLHTKPGQMVWGHFVSRDLISFEDKGVALALDRLGENAYSGGAIEDGGQLHIFYTLHTEKHPHAIRYDGDLVEGDEIYTEEENEKRKKEPRPAEGKDIKEEEIYHSSSFDGESFEKGERVFDNLSLPENLCQTDFRDPCPTRIGADYYLFVGGKDLPSNQGVVIVLRGKSLDHFEYAFHLGPYYELGDMAECPSYRKVDGKDVIVVCGSNTPRRDNDFRNINSSVAVVGTLDFQKGKMDVELIKELDKGDSFYAPQFISGESRPIIIGWMEMWGKRYPTSRLHHGYVGAFSIPRALSYHDGDLYQTPVEELGQYEKEAELGSLPRHADMTMVMEAGSSITIKSEYGRFTIGNRDGRVYLDNAEANSMYSCVRWSNGSYPRCKVRLLLDTSSVELFLEGGKEVITSRVYLDGALRYAINGSITDIHIMEIGEKR